MLNQDELIHSIINSLEKIPPLNVMKNDVDNLKEKAVSMIGATSLANGRPGFVPIPLSSDYNKFLRGDGTWQNVITEDMNDITIVDSGSSLPITTGSILFTISTASTVKKLYRTDLVRFTGDTNDTKMMCLSLGKAGTNDNVNSALKLYNGQYSFTIKPPINALTNMDIHLPPCTDGSSVSIASIEGINNNFYTKILSDSRYLNKTIADTAVEISLYGQGSGASGGLRIMPPGGTDGKSILFDNDGTNFQIKLSSSYGIVCDIPSGTLNIANKYPLVIDLESQKCDINGSANSAFCDNDGNIISNTYAKLYNDVTFTKVTLGVSGKGMKPVLENTSDARNKRITSDSIIKSSADISTNDDGSSEYCYRNISAGKSSSPSSSGVPHGSIYIQYS